MQQHCRAADTLKKCFLVELPPKLPSTLSIPKTYRQKSTEPPMVVLCPRNKATLEKPAGGKVLSTVMKMVP